MGGSKHLFCVPSTATIQPFHPLEKKITVLLTEYKALRAHFTYQPDTASSGKAALKPTLSRSLGTQILESYTRNATPGSLCPPQLPDTALPTGCSTRTSRCKGEGPYLGRS